MGRLFVLAGILLSIPCLEAQTVYRESFDSGPGKWLTGKNRTDPPGWHRNILGFWGEGVPLKWSAKGGHSGGFAYTEPPWYFDDNHGEFYWLYLIFVAYSNDAGLAGADLRDAEVSFYLRGRDPDLKGSRLFFWIQGPGHEGDSNRNWALTSIPWDRILLDGGWQEVRFKLPDDESRWSFMGHTNGGLARRIRVYPEHGFRQGHAGSDPGRDPRGLGNAPLRNRPQRPAAGQDRPGRIRAGPAPALTGVRSLQINRWWPAGGEPPDPAPWD